MNFSALVEHRKPFRHWVGGFLDADTVRRINAEWPQEYGPDWVVEHGKWARKSALMFPRRLTPVAQDLAERLYSPESLAVLTKMTGIELQPDPWFKEGPTSPLLGGGLHEIWPGGMLGVHVDFTLHPAGVKRCLNLLIYLNETWDKRWGGELEMGLTSKATIVPYGGTAVMFETTADSWHGHPRALMCPEGKTRRSLALYYYTEGAGDRPKTVYQ